MSEFQVPNPRTGAVDFTFQPADEAAVAQVCAQLRSAQPAWHAAGLEKRTAVLTDFITAVTEDEALYEALSADTGRMAIARPGRFRWDYDAPLEQIIVSDGERVWIYDVELEQVTARRLGDALGRTPAILLAGDGDVEDAYRVEDLGAEGPLAWVALTPRSDDSHFAAIRIGFESERLRMLELVDGFGQTTRITLHQAEENPQPDAARFAFVPPDGVDVIDETQ